MIRPAFRAAAAGPADRDRSAGSYGPADLESPVPAVVRGRRGPLRLPAGIGKASVPIR